MTKNIKQIAHDLLPLSDAITELSGLITELLEAVKPHSTFDEVKADQYFNECITASKKMTISAKLIREYVQETNAEADKAGIEKPY